MCSMINNPGNDDLDMLLRQYNNQIDLLKEKLLNGVSWDHLVDDRTKITKLAVSIHESFTQHTIGTY